MIGGLICDLPEWLILGSAPQQGMLASTSSAAGRIVCGEDHPTPSPGRTAPQSGCLTRRTAFASLSGLSLLGLMVRSNPHRSCGWTVKVWSAISVELRLGPSLAAGRRVVGLATPTRGFR